MKKGLSEKRKNKKNKATQSSYLLIGQRHLGGLLHFHLILAHEIRIHLDFGGTQGRGLNKGQVRDTSELASQPQEGLLKVVVTLGTGIAAMRKRENNNKRENTNLIS